MLAIAGGKGGCGKTTTTLGLGAALARQRGSVLAVDADRDMPNLHAMAGVPRTPGLADLRERRVEAVRHGVPRRTGIDVVPASPTPAGFDLGRALERLRGHAAHVLVDCPAGAGPAAADPLRAADRVLLVTTLQPPSLRDTAKTAAMARALGTPVAGAALTRVADPSADVAERVASLLGCRVLTIVPAAKDAGTSDDVLTDPAVEASYARLADAIRVPNT